MQRQEPKGKSSIFPATIMAALINLVDTKKLEMLISDGLNSNVSSIIPTWVERYEGSYLT